jgi:hypothetical protein
LRNEGSSSLSDLKGGRWFALLLLCGSLTCPCGAQSLKDCRTFFINSMPESLDRFVSAELVKWGTVKVVTIEEKADCVASFGRRTSKLQVKSSGTETIPKEASVTAEESNERLPKSGTNGAVQAALEIVNRDTSVVVWAASKSSIRGPKQLAEQLVDQLKKDYVKTK